MSRQQDYGPTSRVQEPVMRDVARTEYDLSHWSMKTGAIGSLQTITTIPIVAGDSFSLDASLVMRLSPLRRNLYLDAVVDLFAFYVPHRHVYGSNWVDFMKAGFDEGVTLGTDTLGAQTPNNYNCFGPGILYQSTAYPRWATRPYVQIWNRYFRDPSDVAGTLAETYFTGTPSVDEAKYGLKCAHIKKIWNSANLLTLASADYSLPLSGGEVNLYELAALKGRLRTETSRDWFATRYQDLLKHTYDSTVNIDADQRPELIMRTRQWLSGYDVDGTDDATLGSYSGKSAGVCKINFPTKFFPEHGSLWVMALVRFPPIAYAECNYLYQKAEPTYAQIAGDPSIIRRSTPVSLNTNEIFNAQNVVVGNTPHSQWYREHPSAVHGDYFDTLGHPFLDFSSATVRNDYVYIPPTAYDNVFRTLQLKHWNCQGFINVKAKRFIPDVRESIFAGAE